MEAGFGHEQSRPHSLQAERAVLGRVLRDGERAAGEVIGDLRPEDFFEAGHMALFSRIVENYYADDPIDPLTIATGVSATLQGTWGKSEDEVMKAVREMSEARVPGQIRSHAKIVRDDANRRRLLDLAIEYADLAVEGNPEEVASRMSEAAMRIATDNLVRSDLVEFGDLGRSFVKNMNETRRLKAEGVELGARFGLGFLDRFLRGLRPSELMILAGEPGAGKSSVAWRAAINFAEVQATHDPRVGTLILSLEMGQEPTEMRVAQMLTGISGTLLRDGDVNDHDLKRITDKWRRIKDIPLYFDFTSSLRESQLRALVVEAIRKYNVGLVIVDHFKHLHPDERFRNQTEAEEHKAQFLKDAIAEDLNVAVMCLAHTTKGVNENPDHRPQLTNLRGSYQIAAIADFVAFIHRLYPHASEDAKLSGQVKESDAEIIFRKNRHGLDGDMQFTFDGEKMHIE